MIIWIVSVIQRLLERVSVDILHFCNHNFTIFLFSSCSTHITYTFFIITVFLSNKLHSKLYTVGTDIQDNKCSWLVVQALDRVTKEERTILEENYGQWDDSKVAKVKALYKKLDLEGVFKSYEEESYKIIQTELDKVTLMPRDVFELLLKKIYKRSK
jgi:hypothetical protein